MNPLFRYLFMCNRKKIAVLYFGFITISLLLSFLKVKDTTLLCIAAFSILLIALSSFNKTINNSMIRYTDISAQRNIYANLFFFTSMFIFLLVIGLIFLNYDHGIFQHVLAVFLWGTDFMSILVTCYFIIVITKLIPIKSLMSKIISFIIFFAIFLIIQKYLMDVLSNVITIRSTGFIDENGFIDASLYPSEGFTISGLCFNCLFIIVLAAITGRIIDKKLEI
ncbi:ABC transporter permease [Brevibacillus laterosporus]|uniref:ABC transporter permease n=1 Tax=Brevibacillus laterosporus TaxID=1465 RepID=UPI000BD4DFF2|nr:ABC transporter permease [Brevibacillus laterosporus]PCN46130.1 ABC transporter permease [Brevibacillus laterosporus]